MSEWSGVSGRCHRRACTDCRLRGCPHGCHIGRASSSRPRGVGKWIYEISARRRQRAEARLKKRQAALANARASGKGWMKAPKKKE